MKQILFPASNPSVFIARKLIPILLAVSAILIFIAPFAMPNEYSWISNVVSESTGQNVENAWIARLGFIFFGLAVMWLTTSLRAEWARGAYWCHMVITITFNMP